MRVQGIVLYITLIGTKKCTISARQLSSFIGRVVSTSPVTGKLPTITTRHCQVTVAIAEHWDTPIILGEYCNEEIFCHTVYRTPYTDNQATAKIVEVGSMKFEWHTPALRIVKICCEHSIHLDIEWVPRDCNTKADFISKLSGP